MICSKRILTIFFIFVLAASNSVLLGQVVIKEDIKITPGETVFNAEQSESSTVGYPCDASIPAGDCHHFYQVVWSNSTFPLDPLQQPFNYQGNSCILDPYIGSNYDVEIISGAQYCTIYQCSRNYDEEMIDVGNSLIDISPTDFIPEGNTIQLFDGMPMNIGYCKYIIQFEDTRSELLMLPILFDRMDQQIWSIFIPQLSNQLISEWSYCNLRSIFCTMIKWIYILTPEDRKVTAIRSCLVTGVLFPVI